MNVTATEAKNRLGQALEQAQHLTHCTNRFVMPLLNRLEQLPKSKPRRPASVVNVAGETLHLAAHLCAPLPSKLLRMPVATLRHGASVLRGALDAVVTGV